MTRVHLCLGLQVSLLDFGVGISFFEFEGHMKFVEINDTRIIIKP